MLRGLDIRDMLIIDRLELAFQPGLNVLTGETGAGKSILLDSLGFALGWRGRANLVRSGAAQGEVTAWFELSPDHPARAVLAAAGLPVRDELILRRINTRDGRKTAWINDRRVSGEVLRSLSETLVELHGQNDDRGLLNPREHGRLLDDFADLRAHKDATLRAWRAQALAEKVLATAEAQLLEMKTEEDFLRHAVTELEDLAPQPGEDAELDSRRRLMQAGARISADIANAHEALGTSGAEGAIMDATRWLEGAAEGAEGRLDEVLSALSRTLADLGEAQQGVERCLSDLRFDPQDLEQTEERLFAIRGLARKHGIAADDLADFACVLREKLSNLEQGSDRLRALENERDQARAAYDKAAGLLSKARRKAAGKLDKAMAQELPPLKLGRAVFKTKIQPRQPGPDGMDEVVFTAATNPGAPSGPLNKIASGGELSRFLLALKVCLTAGTPDKTLIFDEIDRGVGGATADAVGKRLATLASGAQVLVVTHSPQVAARGGHHWRVEKTTAKGQTRSRVEALDAGQRVDEIARMLSGDTITDEARAAARALLPD